MHEENQYSFKVIGIAMRTTNVAAIEQGTIQNLWNTFFAEQVSTRIPNKVDDAIVALYYDYETARNGEYTLLIGARVSSLDDIPAGMVGLEVPEEKRAVLDSEVGPLSSIVFDLWKKIWSLEDRRLIDRSYKIDYELYDIRSRNPEKAFVEIHLGVK